MQYAIIKTGGKQYKVFEGSKLKIDKLSSNKNTLMFEDVLLLVNNGEVSIGKPILSGVRVEATLIENIQEEKIKVRKYKAKSRYRRTTGFRALKSLIEVNKIRIDNKKSGEKPKEPIKTSKKDVKK